MNDNMAKRALDFLFPEVHQGPGACPGTGVNVGLPAGWSRRGGGRDFSPCIWMSSFNLMGRRGFLKFILYTGAWGKGGT